MAASQARREDLKLESILALHVEYSEREKDSGILFICSLFWVYALTVCVCMYVKCKDSAAPAHARTRAHRPNSSIRIHVIYMINQAECVM